MDSTQIAKTVDDVDISLKEVVTLMDSLNKKTLTERVSDSSLSNLEKLEVVKIYAEILTSQLGGLLQLEGKALDNHEVKQEIERVQGYSEKLNKIVSDQRKVSSGKQEAGDRFVSGVLSASDKAISVGSNIIRAEEESGRSKISRGAPENSEGNDKRKKFKKGKKKKNSVGGS